MLLSCVSLPTSQHIPNRPSTLFVPAAVISQGRQALTTRTTTKGLTLLLLATSSSLRSQRRRIASRRAEESKRTGEKQLQFTVGDKLAEARSFAAKRFFAVAAWDKNVDPLPVIVASDSTGDCGRRLGQQAFLQLGETSKCRLQVFPNIQSKEAIDSMLEKSMSAKKKPGDQSMLVLATLADPELSKYLLSQAAEKSVPCLNALEPVLAAMEKRFNCKRMCSTKDSKAPQSEEEAVSDSLWDTGSAQGLTIFAASDTSGQLSSMIARAAVKQFPDRGVESITVCPEVRTLEEVDYIAAQAFQSNSLVLFSFASPGLSRFMRQQCERLKLIYADVFQPTVIEMEKYFNYPPVGVAGGMDTEEFDTTKLKWRQEAV
eukprot:TRINITY_DN7470_c0_g2_i1.p1 TRINITY_DN7470_c0_g2~~TRINITY_DN7470_c0_g2_i1.p1  ORF type:complete len:374 (+),score=64.42 TRINITY_DN7470_c0_g2_i1:41-1162(+)